MKVRYYQYGSGQSYVGIPIRLARDDLGIKHLDWLKVEVKELQNGTKQLILTPIEKKVPEKTGQDEEKT